MRARLLAASFGAHALLGAVLGSITPRVRHEVTSITFTDAKKPKAVHTDPPADPDPPPTPSAQPVRAKASPPAASKPVAATTNAQPGSALGDLPDFGLSLSGGGGGVAVPLGGGPGGLATAAVAAKTLRRSTAPKFDDCLDPPAKPKPLSRPQPTYPADAQSAGVAGKVRVEITVDEHGRVVSVRLVQGLGHGCDEAALAAARSMSFEPALRCGKASAATFKVSFNFAPSSP